MTNRANTASATGPSIGWRLGASSWLLLLFVGSGALAALAFGLLAGVARRRSWTIFAGVYAVAAIIARIPEGNLGQITQGSLFLVVMLHGLIINQSWLLLLWGRKENGLTFIGTPRRTPRRRKSRARTAATPRRRAAAVTKEAVPKEAEKLLSGGGTSRSDYVAATPASTRSAPVAPAAAAELVDVNTANQRTLAKLPGMDRELAKAAVTERSTRGGFASLDAFAASTGLQPHEMVRLGSEAFCSARPRAPRSFGRRVDY